MKLLQPHYQAEQCILSKFICICELFIILYLITSKKLNAPYLDSKCKQWSHSTSVKVSKFIYKTPKFFSDGTINEVLFTCYQKSVNKMCDDGCMFLFCMFFPPFSFQIYTRSHLLCIFFISLNRTQSHLIAANSDIFCNHVLVPILPRISARGL